MFQSASVGSEATTIKGLHFVTLYGSVWGCWETIYFDGSNPLYKVVKSMSPFNLTFIAPTGIGFRGWSATFIFTYWCWG